MKKILFIILLLLIILILIFIPKFKNTPKQRKKTDKMDLLNQVILVIDDANLEVEIENNVATSELINKLKEEPITIKAHQYGDFEQVGDLGFSLKADDHFIQTKPGDIVLYQGNQISVFFGTNSWNYTKIGHIKNISNDELEKLLKVNEVELKFILK